MLTKNASLRNGNDQVAVVIAVFGPSMMRIHSDQIFFLTLDLRMVHDMTLVKMLIVAGNELVL